MIITGQNVALQIGIAIYTLIISGALLMDAPW